MPERARALRRNATDAEQRMWSKVRNRQLGGWKFRRQVPVDKYVVDFLCEEEKLIVELDGGQHAELSDKDAERSAELEMHGYRVVRFWNNDVIDNIDGVLETLTRTLEDDRN